MSRKILRTGIIQQHNTANIEDNRNRLAQKMRELASQGAELIVNQELHDSLYFCQTELTDNCDLAVAIPSEATDFYAAIAKELNVATEECLYIGDSDVDMQTGNAAGVTTIGVTWGFRSREVLKENGAAYIVDKAQEIISIVKGEK